MNEAERDAWLAEMWPVCREVPREERDLARQAEWEAQVLFEMNAQAAATYPPESTDGPGDVHKLDAA